MEWIIANLSFILCLFFGVVLLIIEAFIPGFGIAGIFGTLLSLNAIFLSWRNFGVLAGIGTTFVILIIISIVISISIRSLKTGKLSKTPLVLNQKFTSDQGYVAYSGRQSLMGKTGVAISDLHPAGIAEIDAKRYDVITEGEYITKGENIVVNSVEDFRVIVKKI